jgi:peptidoglycan hydrolase-like protein with peptidoglycan-binding domain
LSRLGDLELGFVKAVAFALLAWVALCGTASADARKSQIWFEALAFDQRTDIQTWLVLTGHYDGVVDAAFGKGTYSALIDYARSADLPASGVLSSRALDRLEGEAEGASRRFGLQQVTESSVGLSLPVPLGLTPNRRELDGGVQYSNPDRSFVVELTRNEGGSLEAEYAARSARSGGRSINYAALKPDRFAIAGEENGHYFYTLQTRVGSDLVGFTLEWALDQFEVGSIVATYQVSNFDLVEVVRDAPQLAQQAAPASPAGRRVALIIANSDYDALPLANPRIDAGIVGPALARAGFDVTTVIDADLEEFDEALQAFEARANGADIALFYYAGHGFAVADGLNVQNILMATSADLDSTSARVLRSGGVSLEDITLGISRVAKTTLMFIDACRSDANARGTGRDGRVIPIVRDVGARNIFVGVSTRLGTTADDGVAGKGTAFARAFASHIAKPGTRIDDAFRDVRLEVEQESGDRQSPEIARIDLDAPIVLTPS